MGVMSCSRNSCNNIMCDTYISTVGYICFECQREFKEYIQNNNINLITEAEIVDELERFISTEKGLFDSSTKISIDDFFYNNTKN